MSTKRNQKPRHRSWKARRIGHLYCSPACGMGCLWVDYEKAHANAKAVADDLGPGWTVRVWENLAWHWEVISPCKRVRVGRGYSNAARQFTVYMSRPGDDGILWSAHSTNVRLAIRRVVAAAHAHVTEQMAMFSKLTKPVKFNK